MSKIYKIILILLLIAIFAMAFGCVATNPEKKDYIASHMTKFVDRESDVTCWVYDSYNSGGISCLPNKYIN
jgi:cell division protein FtsL